jgi:DNA (cytosine-5)-methyltransferase 1
MTQNGLLWEQPMLEPITRGTGYGLSPNGVDKFHTPNTTGLDGGSNSRKALKKKMEYWPTPRAFMHKDSTTDRGKHNLGEVVGGKLNPTWTEWLMGWPLGWTDLKPLETDKFRSWQQQHGVSSSEEA